LSMQHHDHAMEFSEELDVQAVGQLRPIEFHMRNPIRMKIRKNGTTRT
jgi:hypothetical protein